MSTTDHTIHLDDLADHVTLTDEGCDATFPSDVTIDLRVKWYPPEPDVGIDYSQPDIVGTSYTLNGQSFTDQAKFAEELYLIIGEWIEEDLDTLVEMLDNCVDNEDLNE